VDNIIQNSVDYIDDVDVLEAIQEAGGRLTNTAIQLDSTIYTLVFIPAEEGDIPPSAVKYQKQVVDFYNSLNSDLETLSKAATAAQIEAAAVQSEAELKKLPTFLFRLPSAKPK